MATPRPPVRLRSNQASLDLKRERSILDGAEQNTPSERVAFVQSVLKVDERGSSEGETMETPSVQRM